jgi:hypothetical protein
MPLARDVVRDLAVQHAIDGDLQRGRAALAKIHKIA